MPTDLLWGQMMHTTTLESHVLGSYPPVGVTVEAECQPTYAVPASRLWSSCMTRWRRGWMCVLLRCLLVTGLLASCTSRSTGPPPTLPPSPPDTTLTPSLR